VFFAPKSADVRIWRTPSPLSAKCPRWRTPLLPDCGRLLWTAPKRNNEIMSQTELKS